MRYLPQLCTEGKISGTETVSEFPQPCNPELALTRKQTSSAVERSTKLSEGGIDYDITVVKDLRISLVCNSLKTTKIYFGGE